MGCHTSKVISSLIMMMMMMIIIIIIMIIMYFIMFNLGQNYAGESELSNKEKLFGISMYLF